MLAGGQLVNIAAITKKTLNDIDLAQSPAAALLTLFQCWRCSN